MLFIIQPVEVIVMGSCEDSWGFSLKFKQKTRLLAMVVVIVVGFGEYDWVS